MIGTGALGGFYGGRLARSGCDVHFLLHGDYEHVRDHGLRVDSVDGDFRLPHVNAYGAAADMPRCDVVAVALKTTANDALADILPHVVADDGVVLVLQNGLGIERQVADIVGPARVMGGLCFLCSIKAGPGHIRHLDYGYVTLGEYDAAGRPGGISRRMRTIGEDFSAAGIRVHYAEDLVLARWKKLVWNIPFNGLCVVLDTTTDRVMADQAARTLAEQLMREVAASALAADGRDIPEPFIASQLADTARMTPYSPSMLLDRRAGRPMEIEAIFGAPAAAARAAGRPAARIETMYHLLKCLDRKEPSAAGI
jgi:2-dehydropantoate 2-reductase